MKTINSIHDLENFRDKLKAFRESFRKTIIVCGGTGCRASRSEELIESISSELAKQGLAANTLVRKTGCHGFCEQGPIVVIEPENIFYCHVSPADAEEIVRMTVGGEELVERLLYTDPVSGKQIEKEMEIPFYQAQDRQLLSQNRQVDPCNIEDYIAVGGYSAISKVLSGISPEKVIEEIKASGLRGRGGAGFPTGRKWEQCREAPGDEKYVICNADEGDPGAYMDRSVLEGNPHLVLEGMMIGAWAAGAWQGYVYVRNEYPLAVKHIRTAIGQAREMGILGENILGTPFSFDVEVARGGGAFVCGESTALMASLEGKGGRTPSQGHSFSGGRPLAQTDNFKQCGNMGQCSGHHDGRGQKLCTKRKPEQQRDQNPCAYRSYQKYGSGGGSHGDLTGKSGVRHRRWTVRQSGACGTDRRSIRRMSAPGPASSAA